MTIEISFDPVIAQLGPVQLGWHGVFTALAVAVAISIGLHQVERQGLSSEKVAGVVTWAVVGGLFGARLFHVLDHLSFYLANPLQAVAVWEGGIAVYGAFVGGVATGVLAARRAGLPAWPLLDAAAPAMLVGQAIGRLGCLANGDAWGAACSQSAPFCLSYTHPNDLLPPELRGVRTYPYPLFEIAAELLLLLGLWMVRDRLWQPGRRFLVAALGYTVIRFGLSFFRQETVVFWGLQEAQVVALLTGLAAFGLLVARSLRPRVPPLGPA